MTAGMIWAVFEAVVPSQPPAHVTAKAAPIPKLTDHLLFVVVDGLRYDVATDPARMPRFAANMQGKSSAEVWAGRISMTTSAILSYGTGQRGKLEQILRNVNPEPPPFNNWLDNARRSGLRLMSVGDPAWADMYRSALEAYVLDPKGVAIDVDFNPQTFAGIRQLKARSPNVLIAHFVTPDHQGHAYGIPSARYRAHIRDFDGQLDALLGEFGPEWTVIVTSDHGAADSGTHGTDTAVQRRSPMFAYGPGIQSGVHPTERIDQVDIAATLATLVGVPAPAHGLGHVLVDFLRLTPEQRALVACASAERALDYGRAMLSQQALSGASEAIAPCASAAAPERRITSAAGVVRSIDAAITSSTGLSSLPAWAVAICSALVGLLAAVCMYGNAVFARLPAASVLLAVALALTLWVERTPGKWPDIIRVVFYVICNLGVLFTLLWPGHAAASVSRLPLLAPALLPGILLASYTSNTQPHSYVALAIGALLLVLIGTPRPGRESLVKQMQSSLRWPEWVALLIAILLLFPAGTRKSDLFPSWFFRRPDLVLYAALALVIVWVLAHARVFASARAKALLFGLVLIVGGLLLRRVAPPWLGRGATLACGALAAVLAARGLPHHALFAGVASYAWVSRDFEFLALVPSLAVAELVAAGLRRRGAGALSAPSDRDALLQWLVLVTFLFGLLYVQRVGLLGSLDISALDWGAGGFGDPSVPAAVVAIAIVYKYVLAQLLVAAAFTSRLYADAREPFARAMLMVFVARAVALLLMLFVCGGSFWTALRVLGDLPFALVGTAAAALVWIAVLNFRSRSPDHEASSRNPLPAPSETPNPV